MTKIYAHRGASRAERENTLAAFARAVSMGAHGVELDVRRSLDDHLVVHHNPHLHDGRLIRATPRREIPGEVPDLAAALDACDDLIVNVEIKNDPSEEDFDPADWLADAVIEELRRRDRDAQWLISSFRMETVDRCRFLAPSIATAWLTVEIDEATPELVAGRGHQAVHPWYGSVDEASIAAFHAAGVEVNVWTCDSAESMADLIRWGIDGICTNVPDVGLAVLAG